MGYSVTSWYIDQLTGTSTAPKREFWLGPSDYSERVVKWPKITRTIRELRPVNPRMDMANEDGALNFLVNSSFALAASGGTTVNAAIKYGFTHPTSGDEMATLFMGSVKAIDFRENRVSVSLRDKLWKLEKATVGDDTNVVSYINVIPSDIMWDLITSYGPLDNTASTSNADIDYASFLIWSEQFSTDQIKLSAYYNGTETLKAMRDLVEMTDSAVWVEGDDKLHFIRFNEITSLDDSIAQDLQTGLDINVDPDELSNKQWVYGNYNVGAQTWGLNVFHVSSDSLTQFGLLEDVLKSEHVWYTTSLGANLQAQRLAFRNNTPPIKYKLQTAGYGLQRYVSETLRFVDSFYGVTSISGWRSVEVDIDLERGLVTHTMDSAVSYEAFYLDVDSLDGNKRLL